MSKYILYFETLEDAEGFIIEAPFSGYVNNLNMGILSLKNGVISNGVVCETHRIYYTSSDNNVITPYSTDGFGASIISNTYDNVGILDFDGDVTSVGDLAFYYCESLTSIIIPNSVTRIGFEAFAWCYSLASVTIPNSVTSIGDYAFYHCSSLTSITIPNSVKSIGSWAFAGCSSLTAPVYNAHCFAYMPPSYRGAYTIPNGIKQIADAAFAGCSSLTSITIPNSVTSIGYQAFNGCSSLTSITCEATTPPTLGSNNNLSNVTSVYVPAESVDLYKTATNWSYYSGVIKPIE